MKYVLSEKEYMELKKKAMNWDEQYWAIKERVNSLIEELATLLRENTVGDELEKDLSVTMVIRLSPFAKRRLKDILNRFWL
jgi:hypothetical protein